MAAANWFSEAGSLACVQLFYSRLITESLYAAFPTINFHPSLLPAFPGMNSVRKAMQHGARFLGATAHLVDAGVDTGPIIAQACDPLVATSTDAELDRISYLQKVQLGLIVIHLINNRQLLFSQDNQRFKLTGALCSSPSCNPALACDDLNSAYRDLIASEQVEVPA